MKPHFPAGLDIFPLLMHRALYNDTILIGTGIETRRSARARETDRVIEQCLFRK